MCKDRYQPCQNSWLPPFLNPKDPNEVYINNIVVELKKQHTVDVISSPALLRKFCTLKNKFHQGSNCGYLRDIKLTLTGAQVSIRQRHHDFRVWQAQVEFNHNATPCRKSEDLSPFAWIYAALGINDLCRYSCCVTKAFDFFDSGSFECPVADCSTKFLGFRDLKQHWRQHCFLSELYHCDAPGCFHKSKRFGDLERHISTSHCLNAKKFPCSYLGCERGGDNGFPRKDKLKDHFEKVHRGVGIPPKQPRTLAPRN